MINLVTDRWLSAVYIICPHSGDKTPTAASPQIHHVLCVWLHHHVFPNSITLPNLSVEQIWRSFKTHSPNKHIFYRYTALNDIMGATERVCLVPWKSCIQCTRQVSRIQILQPHSHTTKSMDPALTRHLMWSSHTGRCWFSPSQGESGSRCWAKKAASTLSWDHYSSQHHLHCCWSHWIQLHSLYHHQEMGTGPGKKKSHVFNSNSCNFSNNVLLMYFYFVE